jgi:hypothetical protein
MTNQLLEMRADGFPRTTVTSRSLAQFDRNQHAAPMDSHSAVHVLSAAFDSFDVSGSSVSALQYFLDDVADVSVEDALETLRPYCAGLSAHMLNSMIVANRFEVQGISISCLSDVEPKLAIRLFTINEPYQLFRWFNKPFIDKVRASCLRSTLEQHRGHCSNSIHRIFLFPLNFPCQSHITPISKT